MTLPEGVLTQNNSQNKETTINANTENVKAVDNTNAKFTIEGTESNSSKLIDNMDEYAKPNLTDIAFEILRHIPFVNLISLFVLYLAGKDTKRHEILIFIESLAMLIIDILLVVLFFRFTSLSYEQLANLFTILQ